MKKILFAIFTTILCLSQHMYGQTFTPIGTSGYNFDAVAEALTASATTTGPIDGSNFVLSAIGIFTSAISIVWTWGNGTRLSKRLLRTIRSSTSTTSSNTETSNDTPNSKLPLLLLKQSVSSKTKLTAVSTMIRRAITIGVIINCVGLLCNLLAAQQIVGLFAIKVFTSGTSNRATAFTTTSALFNDNALQPLDILIIQANTNVLLSQYISLIALLSLIPTILHKLQTFKHDVEEEDRTMTQTTTSTTTTIINDE